MSIRIVHPRHIVVDSQFTPIILALGWLRQNNVSTRPAWGTQRDPFSKSQKQNETNKNEVNYQDRMGIIQSD